MVNRIKKYVKTYKKAIGSTGWTESEFKQFEKAGFHMDLNWGYVRLVEYKGYEKNVIIPDGVDEIGIDAFKGCDTLKSITIPNSVESISYGVFGECPELEEWVISADHPYFKVDGPCLLTKDGKEIIACLPTAKNYRIPEGVTSIKMGAFSGCGSLTSVFIPDSVESIRGSAFAGCQALKEWSISPDHPFFKSDGPYLLTKDGETLIACPSAAGEWQIPDSVKDIGDGVFSGCDGLTSVVIPEGVTRIGYRAFANCSSLRVVDIPDTVKKIEKGYNVLVSIMIPDGLKLFGGWAFENCPKLEIKAPRWSEAASYAGYFKIPVQTR